MCHSIDWFLILKLCLAMFFGATIGLERYIHGRPAGLRTNILVCVAFASIAVLSEKYYLMSQALTSSGWRPDPGRLAAGGLTGIGFLGAGLIIRSGVSVHGLTTAAGVWAVSVIGLALGSGQFQLATLLYVITFVSLMGLRYLEPMVKKDIYKKIDVSLRRDAVSLDSLEALVKEKGLQVLTTDVRETCREEFVTYTLALSGRKERFFHDAYRALASFKDVQSISLKGEDSV